jgi:1-phosphofructokinase
MIVTLTPNPSVDRTLEIATLEPGQVNRATTVRVDPGGKGVNVARALVLNGHDACAVLPLGGREGEHLADLLRVAGVDVHPVPVAAAVRENISLVEPGGRVTKINAPGPRLSSDEVAALEKATAAAVDGATWAVASGSLPPGVPDDVYARLATHVHQASARLAVDTSGRPFLAALAGGPDLVKPNTDELADAIGRPVRTLGDVLTGAAELRERGVAAVLVSLGVDGAVLVDRDGAWHATSPPRTARSNVGAGDAALAGFLAGGGAGPDALARAVAFGAAAVRLPGSQMPGPDDVADSDVEIRDVDPSHRLRG